jgi:hypothetical protein
MTTLDNPSNLPDPAAVSPRPTAIRYGLIAGLVLIVLSVLYNVTGMIDYTGQNSNVIPNILNWGTIIAALVLAIKHHRDNELGGFISLGRCVGLGSLTSLVIGVISGIFGVLYFTVIDPGLKGEILSQLQEQFEEQGLDENAIDMAMSWTENMFSPLGLFLMTSLSTLLGGVILSLIIGAIMKKTPPHI